MRDCPVLYATLEDIGRPFEAFIEKHEKKIAQAGIAKIVAPEGWSPRREGYPEDLDFTIERAIRQHATGTKGLYRGLYIEEQPMSLRSDFRPQALAPENTAPATTDPRDLERKYWKNVTLRAPLYGADVPGSLFDEDCGGGWNLRRLDTVLSRVLHDAGHSLPGVNEPYLYFGMWRSTFAWHTEDLDLYSVNYLHYGAPKQWYCIPPDSRKRFEGLIRGMLPDLFKACPEFFRHKELIISPQFLDTFAIPYIKTVQHPREFIINYPGAYHAGYNCGYNCAESVNFGTRRWVPLGAAAGVCKCNPDSVTIDMRLFRSLVPAQLLPPSVFEDTSSGSEGEQEEQEEAPPPPRRRGRPRKRPLPEDAVLVPAVAAAAAAAGAHDAKRQCIPQQSNGGGDSGAPAPPRRRRGRPPKEATLAAAAAAAAATAAAAVAAAAEWMAQGNAAGGDIEGHMGWNCGRGGMPPVPAATAAAGPPLAAPRRRGRPPKRPTTVGGAAVAPTAAAGVTAAAVAVEAAVSAPPKRPRGRPRKHPLALPSQATAADAATAATAATATPGRDAAALSHGATALTAATAQASGAVQSQLGAGGGACGGGVSEGRAALELMTAAAVGQVSAAKHARRGRPRKVPQPMLLEPDALLDNDGGAVAAGVAAATAAPPQPQEDATLAAAAAAAAAAPHGTPVPQAVPGGGPAGADAGVAVDSRASASGWAPAPAAAAFNSAALRQSVLMSSSAEWKGEGMGGAGWLGLAEAGMGTPLAAAAATAAGVGRHVVARFTALGDDLGGDGGSCDVHGSGSSCARGRTARTETYIAGGAPDVEDALGTAASVATVASTTAASSSYKATASTAAAAAATANEEELHGGATTAPRRRPFRPTGPFLEMLNSLRPIFQVGLLSKPGLGRPS